MGKTTTLHVHHAFLYISWPSVHDYDVKIPNSLEHKAATSFFFFSSTSILHGSYNLEKVFIFSSRLEKSGPWKVIEIHHLVYARHPFSIQ